VGTPSESNHSTKPSTAIWERRDGVVLVASSSDGYPSIRKGRKSVNAKEGDTENLANKRGLVTFENPGS